MKTKLIIAILILSTLKIWAQIPSSAKTFSVQIDIQKPRYGQMLKPGYAVAQIGEIVPDGSAYKFVNKEAEYPAEYLKIKGMTHVTSGGDIVVKMFFPNVKHINDSRSGNKITAYYKWVTFMEVYQNGRQIIPKTFITTKDETFNATWYNANKKVSFNGYNKGRYSTSLLDIIVGHSKSSEIFEKAGNILSSKKR